MNDGLRTQLVRSRWAAVGAAVAVTLGAGGMVFVDAAKDSGDRPVTVFLDEPCRLRDTRPDRGVGGRVVPLGPAEAYTVQGTGVSGNCDVPADAVGLVTNVTAVQATENTNLRLYPTGGTVPATSNLNPRPGAAPTPNAVTVGLSGSGQFDIRNAAGNVHVIIDVAAYLVDHTHDDRYYTQQEIDAALSANAAFAVSDRDDETYLGVVGLGNDPQVIASVSMTPAAAGQITANSVTNIRIYDPISGAPKPYDPTTCSITTGSVIDDDYTQYFATRGDDLGNSQLSGTRVIDVAGGAPVTINLVCQHAGSPYTTSLHRDSVLTATFTPAP